MWLGNQRKKFQIRFLSNAIRKSMSVILPFKTKGKVRNQYSPLTMLFSLCTYTITFGKYTRSCLCDKRKRRL